MTQQQNKKKQNEVITLCDDILDEDNPFNNIKTDDIILRMIYLTITILRI